MYERKRILTKFLKLKCKVKIITGLSMKSKPMTWLEPEKCLQSKGHNPTVRWKINRNLNLEQKKS